MDKILSRYRVSTLIILIITGLFMTACGALEKANSLAWKRLPAPSTRIPGMTCFLNFTNNPLFCGAPGAVLLVDSPQGRFLEATGLATVEEQTPMQVTDALEIGSITKSFAAAVGLQLQEEGVLSLDDPLAQWLPEMAAQVPNGEQMSLLQLANHTSGIWDYGDPISEAGQSDASIRKQAFTPEEIIAYAVENGNPQFDPGEDGAYSNTNYILFGMAVGSGDRPIDGRTLPNAHFYPTGDGQYPSSRGCPGRRSACAGLFHG